jgi:hypothetical protein
MGTWEAGPLVRVLGTAPVGYETGRAVEEEETFLDRSKTEVESKEKGMRFVLEGCFSITLCEGRCRFATKTQKTRGQLIALREALWVCRLVIRRRTGRAWQKGHNNEKVCMCVCVCVCGECRIRRMTMKESVYIEKREDSSSSTFFFFFSREREGARGTVRSLRATEVLFVVSGLWSDCGPFCSI